MTKPDKRLLARLRQLRRGDISVRQIAEKVTVEGYCSRSGAALSKSTVARLLRA